jgi:heme-degrading monooxygenase HmoA
VFILVQWESREALQSYLDDPALADLHHHREKGGDRYLWHLFDRLEDLRPLLK